LEVVMVTLRRITMAVVALLVAPLAAVAQESPKLPRIGLLVGGSPAFDPGRPHDHGASSPASETAVTSWARTF
jgi:hypothetical protein